MHIELILDNLIIIIPLETITLRISNPLLYLSRT